MSRREDAALEARRRALGSAKPHCSAPGCDEDDPRGLTGVAPSMLCAEHAAARDGRRRLEEHHVAGRVNRDATVTIPANLHAVLTFNQQTSWPLELLRNPSANPLARAGASIRGSRETTEATSSKFLRPTEDELADVDAFLRDKHGEAWFAEFEAWREAKRHEP